MKCTKCGSEGGAMMGYRMIGGKVVIRRDEHLCPRCAGQRLGEKDVYIQLMKERTLKSAE
jgi:transcriptional regulator NrdR family protein